MSREEWRDKGSKDLVEIAKGEVKKILALHQPKPLDKDIQKKLEEIVRKAENNYQ